jgi:hypothetical protein
MPKKKFRIFGDVESYSQVEVDRCFWGAYYVHNQGDESWWFREDSKLQTRRRENLKSHIVEKDPSAAPGSTPSYACLLPAWGCADGDCLIPQFLWDLYALQEIYRKRCQKALAEFKFQRLGKSFYGTKKLWWDFFMYDIVLCQIYGSTGGTRRVGTHSRSESGYGAWVALCAHSIYTDTEGEAVCHCACIQQA